MKTSASSIFFLFILISFSITPSLSYAKAIGKHPSLIYHSREHIPMMPAMNRGKKESNSAYLVRDYNKPVTKKDKDNLTFILTTLAKQPLYKIALQKSALKKAGDEINHLHPLQFLYTVFSDEELKVCVRKIPGRDWVGKEFIGGLVGSLREEDSKNNMTPEFIADFSNKLNINIDQILPYINAHNWEGFVYRLIEIIPREAGSDRYNM